MTTEDAYEQIHSKQPPIIYVSGKTCTGKTTFSNRLRTACAYEVIELDQVILEVIVQPFGLHDVRGDVLVSIYKTADNTEWLTLFVTEVQKRIKNLRAQGKKIIIDGAVANMDVLRSIFDELPNVTYIYFHPLASSADYLRNIMSRFQDTTAQHENGLPNNFWKCIDKKSFAQFCNDRVITPELKQDIANYAQRSSDNSIARLASLQQTFPHVIVVEV